MPNWSYNLLAVKGEQLVGLCPSTYDLDEDLCDLFNKSEVAE